MANIDKSLIHIHVWKGDKITREVDFYLTGEYDDHYQFSGRMFKRHIEIRVMKPLTKVKRRKHG